MFRVSVSVSIKLLSLLPSISVWVQLTLKLISYGKVCLFDLWYVHNGPVTDAPQEMPGGRWWRWGTTFFSKCIHSYHWSFSPDSNLNSTLYSLIYKPFLQCTTTAWQRLPAVSSRHLQLSNAWVKWNLWKSVM